MYLKLSSLKNSVLLSIIIFIISFYSNVQANSIDLYGSFRFQAESVKPDNETSLNSYHAFRDAYSRIGLKAQYQVKNNLEIYSKFEIALDIPNKQIQGSWDQKEEIRIAKLGIKGTYGDLSIGRLWLPYYNAIAAPVDMFSSYYSGFASYSSLRLSDTLIYTSPAYNGLSTSLAFSHKNGARKANGEWDERFQAALNYTKNNLTFSLGYDQFGGENHAALWGATATWQANKKLNFAIKYEAHKSNISDGYGRDKDAAINLYTSYTYKENTFKAMIASVDNYGENVFHLGWDFKFNNKLIFFTEYYHEQTTAVLTQKLKGGADTCWSCNGGKVFLVGIRYDFNLNKSF